MKGINRTLFVGSVATLALLGITIVQGMNAQSNAAPQLVAQAESAPPDNSPVSEAELEQFAHALVQVKIIEQRVILAILAEVQSQGFSEGRFRAIASASSPEAVEPPLTTAEQEKLTAINAQIQSLEQQALTQMTQAVVEQGLTYKRYQAILATVRQQPELKDKAQALIAEIVSQLQED